MFSQVIQRFEIKTFLFCCAFLCLKVLGMALLVAKWRLKKEIFISPEDIVKRGKVAYDDPEIERVRRAHLNDLENIPFFFAAGLMYLLTRPNPLTASFFFIFYTISRSKNPDIWGIVELQGDLESRVSGPLQSQFVGDLHFGMQSNGIPTLIIGHHILYGKAVPMEKPWAIMEKVKEDDKTEYVIKALIEKKLVFKIRPKPIIAAVPGI